MDNKVEVQSLTLSCTWRRSHQKFRFYKDVKTGRTRFGIPFWQVGKIQWVSDPKFEEKFAGELMDNKVEVPNIILSHIWKR